MRARRRRLWTWTLTTVAALIVIAATISGLFAVAVRAVPGYRQQLEQQLQVASGQPLQIGALSLRWRGLWPALVLDDVRIAPSAGAPAAAATPRLRRVELVFSPRRLIRGDWMPGEVDLRGLVLSLRRDSDGQWQFEGFVHHQPMDLQAALKTLSRVSRVRLDDSRLNLTDTAIDAAPIPIVVQNAELSGGDGHYRFVAGLQPPKQYASSLDIGFDGDGDPADWTTMSLIWQARAEGLGLLPGIAAWLAPDSRVELDNARVKAEGTLQHGQLGHAQAQFTASRLAGIRGGHTVAEARGVDAALQWQPQAGGGLLQLQQLRYAGAAGPVEQAISGLQLQHADTGGMQLSAQRLRLDDLAPWLPMLRGIPADLAPLQQLHGELRDAQLQLGPADVQPRSYTFKAGVAGLGIAAAGDRPGVDGIAGSVQIDADGGRFDLSSDGLSIDWPGQFGAPVAFDTAHAALHWTDDAQHWQLTAEHFDWALRGAHGSGHVVVDAGGDAATRIDLQMKLAASDLVALKPLLPATMGPHSRAWLQRAVQRGRVDDGELEIQGPLDLFPYDDPQGGHWALDLDLSDTTLAFSTQWPPLQHGKAALHFAGRGLDVNLQQASIGAVQIDAAHGRIPDLHAGDLSIDGSTHGDAADYYALLRNSPLKDRLGGLLDNTAASGPGTVDLHLDVPLRDEHPDARASGTVKLDHAQLQAKGLDQPITALSGTLRFGPDGISGDPLTGQLGSTALKGRVRPDAEAHEGVLEVGFDVSADDDNGLFAHYVPATIRKQLDGSAHWTATLPLSGPAAGHLQLSSPLRGLRSRLPPPLRKAIGTPMPLTVQFFPSLIRLDQGDALSIALRTEGAVGRAAVRGVELRFGPGAPPRATADGIVATGTPALFDVPAWIAFATAGSDDGADALKMNHVDVLADQLAIGDFRIPQTRVVVDPVDGGDHIRLSGDGAQGDITLQRGADSHVQAQFAQLHLHRVPAPTGGKAGNKAGGKVGGEFGDSGAPDADDEDAASEPPHQPGSWPTVEFSCEHLYAGDADLGRLTFTTARIDGGQHVTEFGIHGGLLEAGGDGSWQRIAGRSSAALNLQLDTREVGTVLQGFGYAQTLSGKKGHFEAQLKWPADSHGVTLAMAQGKVHIDVDSGALKAVEPGAGRILGLLNLYALPRRLLLNFSDVTNKGLGFDTLRGDFVLGGGDARTDNLDIRAPSVKLEVRGRIGLAARDYDEHITVNPQGVSTGVTVGAALLGGPAGAAIALIAQQLFDKPLDRLTQFSYRVTGSWDNPEISRGDHPPEAKPDAGSADKPPPPPATKPSGDAHD